jgi:hypothetical protein
VKERAICGIFNGVKNYWFFDIRGERYANLRLIEGKSEIGNTCVLFETVVVEDQWMQG